MQRLAVYVVLGIAATYAADTTAKMSTYFTDSGNGACRMRYLDGDKSLKFASVPGKKMSTCGRCVQVTCQDPACKSGSSVVAYVTDVKEGGQASDPMQLSPEAVKALTSDPINNPISVSWKFTACPDAFIPGNVKACFMDGVSADYIPLQFFNSHRAIESATFNGVAAKPSTSGFYYESGKISEDAAYYSKIDVKLTADGSTIQGILSFKNPSTNKDNNCADLGAQFDKPSTAAGEAVDPLNPSSGDKSSGGSGGSSVLLPAILGGVGGLILIAGIIFCIRRHRNSKDDDEDNDVENGAVYRGNSTKDIRGGFNGPTKPPGPQQVVSAYNTAAAPAVLGGNTPTLHDNTPSTTYSRLDSDTPPALPRTPPQPLVVPERQPSANARIIPKTHQNSNQTLSTSYSEMFNDVNRGMYARGSSILLNNTRDDRKSFDIDEERDVDSPSRSTEHDAQLNAMLKSGALSLHEDPFAAPRFPDDHMTSPESYVRATSLPRQNSQKTMVPTFSAPRTSAGQDSQSNLLQYPHKKREITDGSSTTCTSTLPRHTQRPAWHATSSRRELILCTVGKVGVVGGCIEYTGAPYYAGIAALKTGADLCHIFCTPEAAIPIKCYSPELIVHPFLARDQVDKILTVLPRLDALVIGCGLGRDLDVIEATKRIITAARDLKLPLVLDGDALFLLATDITFLNGYSNVILTPNKMEYARLCLSLGLVDTLELSKTGGIGADLLASKLGNLTLLQKGSVDVLSNGHDIAVQDNKGSPRRCGGQGDVLAGCIGTFLAWSAARSKLGLQPPVKYPLMMAALGGSMLIRESARLAFKQHSRAMTTPDLIQSIGDAFKNVLL